MNIPKVTDPESFFTRPESFDLHTIDSLNWAAEFPSHPDVHFAIAHTGTDILLKYFVSEPYTLARVTHDNGKVWTDSCVEFFVSFDDGGYYNLECTCTGRALLGFQKSVLHPELASRKVLGTIVRRPSLGCEPFEERRNQTWNIELVLPVEVFFRHRISDLSGTTARGNFFKCGDNLSVPHFLSWQPIDSPKPNFHLEEFFGELHFE